MTQKYVLHKRIKYLGMHGGIYGGYQAIERIKISPNFEELEEMRHRLNKKAKDQPNVYYTVSEVKV